MKKLVLLLMLFVYVCIGCGFSTTAFAESSFSSVLEDLEQDPSFNAGNYPMRSSDKSLQLIQVAESTDDKLLIYVYQPSGPALNLVADSINMSTRPRNSLSDIRNYKLKLASKSGTLYKYIVEDFTVQDLEIRYYTITTIFRAFDKDLDDPISGDNTVTYVEYPVGKEYTFGMLNGEYYVRVSDIETIEVTSKFVGFVRYPDGFQLFNAACDSHFVAFNTNRRIDQLLEAEVYYTYQSYSYSVAPVVGKTEHFGESISKNVLLKHDQDVDYTGGGLFAPSYSWKRIQSIDEFISSVDIKQSVFSGAVLDVSAATNLTDQALKSLQGKQWVLRFAETSYEDSSYSGTINSFSTLVGDVTILRLKFETDGLVYNLGVVDNMQTGSKDPSNDTDIDVDVKNWWKLFIDWMNGQPWWVWALIIVGVLGALSAFIKPVGEVVLFALNLVCWIVSAPFRLVVWIVQTVRNKRQ